jgi:nitrite reductase (NADH) large subunit
MSKKKLVMVGNGMAGVRTLEELLKIAPDQYEITVFGAEPHPNYNRILLSPVLAGEMTIQDIILNDHIGMRSTASRCTWARKSAGSTACSAG